MNTPSIPPRTRQKLANPAPPGGRHAQMVEIACSLLGQGFNPDAVFHQLRPNYGPDVPDREIHQLIGWAHGKGFATRTPHGSSFRPRFTLPRPGAQPDAPSPAGDTPEALQERIGKFLQGFTCDAVDLWEASPVRLPEDWRDDAATLIHALYAPGEQINVVTEFLERAGKASPMGRGQTLPREAWLARLLHGTPQSAAGAWVRMNPLDGRGIADDNVTACRFALIEFDSIPPALQLPVIARLPVPIAAVLTSGGKSLHAWVQLNAPDAPAFRQLVGELLTRLKCLGVDAANKNPSRLSRLPGAQRILGAADGGRQRLLYLNPSPHKEILC